MSDERYEELSALMDGAVTGHQCDRIVRSTESDAELNGVWTRYHLIGDALRDSLPRQCDLDFAERVRIAVEAEPSIVAAPARIKQSVPARPYLTWAAAAAIGGLAVLGAQAWREYLPNVSTQEVSASFGGEIKPLPIATQQWQPEHPSAPTRLSRYLVNHSRSKSEIQLEGVLPVVRLVGYESESDQ